MEVAQLRRKLVDVDLIDELVGFRSPRQAEGGSDLVAAGKCERQLVCVDL
jgi:hypothetical protein